MRRSRQKVRNERRHQAEPSVKRLQTLLLHPLRKHVALIGFMGCGKSTVGKNLARKLNFKFLDTDELIVSRTGMSIPEIFEKFGESAFRALEKEVVGEALKTATPAVVALGGGFAANSKNLKLLKLYSRVFYLKTPFKIMLSRIRDDANRPLAKLKEEKLRALFESREPFYEQADFVINAGLLKPDEVASKVASILKSF